VNKPESKQYQKRESKYKTYETDFCPATGEVKARYAPQLLFDLFPDFIL
jgi:hypothetical protein